MEIVAVVTGVAAAYFAVKYFTVNLSMMAYIYWTVEKKHAQPTKDELNACKKAVLHQMFRLG